MLKKTFWHWVVCAIAAALLLTPKAALAQQGAAVLTGTVVDAANKAPVADVVVTVTSPNLQGEQMVVTDSSGLYRIPALPPGVYTIRAEKEQFKPYANPSVTLRADTTIRVNVELLPEALKGEEVTVVARPPSVDVGSSSTGQNISADFTRRIPVGAPGGKGGGSRSFESVAETTPGANADTYGTSINGTTSPENQYVLDGMSVNNPAFGVIGTPLSMEFIKEVNVISGGYMPEYGRATGGMLNVVTKSGSNEFHGGVFGYYSPGALEGNRSLVRRAGQTVATDTTLGYIGDIGADVGGPIVKDKLWFYVGLDFAKTRFNLKRTLNRSKVVAGYDPASGVPPVLDPVAAANGEQEYIQGTQSDWAAESTQIQAMGKLTYAVNQDNQLHLAVYATPSQSGGNGKYGISPLTGQPEADPRTTAGLNGPYNALAHQRLGSSFDTSLKWDSAFDNKRILINTTIGWHHESGGILASDGSGPEDTRNGSVLAGQQRVAWRRNNAATGYHQVYELDPTFPMDQVGACNPAMGYSCPVTTYNTGGPGALNRQNLDRYQGRSILTYLLQGAGHHVIKAGVDVEYNTYEMTKAFSGQQFFRESTAGTSFADYRQYSFLTGPDQLVLLPYLHTKVKSVTAGGFLQDSWSVMDKVTLNIGMRYDAQFLYDTYGNRGLSLPNQWSPRIGVIYDPTQSGRAKLFGNFARFYESVPLDMADRSLSGEASAIGSHNPVNPANASQMCNPTVPNQPPGLGPCLGDANRRQASPTPPNHYYTLAGGGGSIPIDPDIRPQSSDEFVAGGEYEIIRDARVGLSYTKRWMNYVIEDMSRDEAQTYFLGNPGYGAANDFPKPRRDYDAVTVYLTKIFADDWLAQASYTISYLRGNYAGLFRPETQQLDPNINSDFDLRSLLANRDGPLPGDRTHQIKLYGAKDWILTPEHHVTTGMTLKARSGAPTGYYGSHPQYGLDETFILPRGSGERNPWEFGADLALGYRFQIDKDKSVQATIDIFNLFNFQAVTLTDQTYTRSDVLPLTTGARPDSNGTIPGVIKSGVAPPPASAAEDYYLQPDEKNPNFGRPLGYQSPRVFRFGLRTTF